MSDHRHRFLQLALTADALRFGQFTLKSGRLSPYFFNAGRFDSGARMSQLAACYADAVEATGLKFDVVFGPAYKGIPLATATACEFAQRGRDLPLSFNRKEAKDHGEGGTIVGAKLHGKVVIIDDVISAGTSVRESVDMIRAAGAEPCAVLIALDRMERSGPDGQLSPSSAVQEVSKQYGIPVISIGNLDDLFGYLNGAGADPELLKHKEAVSAYRTRYGI